MRLPLILTSTLIVISTIGWASTPQLNQRGQNIYRKHCMACHLSGVANAPKAHDEKAWQARVEAAMAVVSMQKPKLNHKQLKQQAILYLVKTAQQGKGAMPPGAMCPKCTDADYLAAIQYMMKRKPQIKPEGGVTQ